MTYPSFIYGTAWKKDATLGLVVDAVESGFAAIDTANQPKHYNEPGVGEALSTLARKGIGREKLFLQTKFTSPDGQDHRIPYDPDQSVPEQVRRSFQVSLEHLKTDFLDSYLLHGPYSHPDLVGEDWEVWQTLEEIHRSGGAKSIGISNVNIGQLKELVKGAKVKPMAVQNRCYAVRGWDRDVREFCKANGIVYQGFSLLTANVPVLHDPRVQAIAKRLELNPMQVIFLFSRQVGMVPLTGTSQREHMADDLKALKYQLTADELATIDRIADV